MYYLININQPIFCYNRIPEPGLLIKNKYLCLTVLVAENYNTYEATSGMCSPDDIRWPGTPCDKRLRINITMLSISLFSHNIMYSIMTYYNTNYTPSA